MKKWEKFSDEELKLFVKESHSFQELAIKLGYSEKSGSSGNLAKEMTQQKHLDTSHFNTEIWNKGKFDYSRFKYGKVIKTSSALPAIIALRGNKCERCGLSEWQGERLVLEVHHIDGNRLNNTLENLQLLCPNCHSLTDNYKGKNNNGKITVTDEQLVEALQSNQNIRKALISLGLAGRGGNYERAHELIDKYQISFPIKDKKYYCNDCGKEIETNVKYCLECRVKHISKVQNKPDRNVLKNMIRTQSFTSIGQKYGISDNSVRKWCIKLNLPSTKQEINSYSDEEWALI